MTHQDHFRNHPGLCPAGSPVPVSLLHVTSRCLGECLPVGFGQFADDPAWHPGDEHTRGQDGAGKHHGAGGYQGARSDPGAPEHDGAYTYQRAGFDVSAMHGRSMPEADSVLQDGRLTGVDMDAAQVLNVALVPDHDLGVIGPEDAAIPDRCAFTERHPPDQNRSGRYPGFRMDGRAIRT